MPGSKTEKPSQSRPQQQAESASRPSRVTATVPGGKPQSTKLKPPLKQPRGRSPSPASRGKDAATEKKDSESTHNSKGHNEGNQKKDDKVDSTQKTRVIHHKMHDKHAEDDGSKFHDMNSKSHTSRHGKQYVDKSDKHKLIRPESSVVSSRSKSPSSSKQTESVEVLEKTSTKAPMEHEGYEVTDDHPGSDKEVPPEEEGDSSEHSTGDNPVDRISYTKKELMALKTCEIAQQRPAELTDEILNLLNSDANRPKYPATLSLRKEGNESRAFPDISLSPQRGSFSSGCKYKSNRESVNKDGSGDAPATPLSSRIPEEGSKFSFHDDNTQKEFSQYRTPHGPQSFSWHRSQSSSTYRDYNGGSSSQDDDGNNRPSGRPSYSRYSQSYQQESYRGNGNSRGYYQSESYSEPEPEWMQFGPSSRTEFMELGGEDEIEKMREEFKARQKKVDEAFNKNTTQDNVETPSDVSDKDGELVSCTSPDVNTANDDELEHNNNVFNNNYCNDETMSEQQAGTGKDEGYKMAAGSNPSAEEQPLLSANSNDEFAVDLNRILNICDDMEDDDMMHQQQSNIHSEGSQLSKLFGAHLPKHSGQEHSQFTSDPSNLLMQVLGVQRDGQVNSCRESSQKSLVVGNKPANALTLDEVLAKENISVSGDDQGDQSAFKKFLASIQQQQSPGDLPTSNSVMENNRHFNDTTHLTNLFGGQERGAVRDSLEQYSFSIPRDHVGHPQLDEQSQPLPIGYNRYSRQMEQQQQQNIGLPHQFYMHDEERMSSKEMCNSEQQRMQQSSLQPPVQRIDQKKLLEQHIQQDVQEHVRQHLEQQQRQRAAAQFRQQQQIQQQQQQARMKHQHMMAMEQQKRAAVLSGGTGGMMYSGSVPPPQSHKPPMANQPLGFMPTSVMKHNFKQTRTVPEVNKPSTRLEQDLNQKAVSTHSSLTGLISHSMPEDDHQFLHQDQPRPHYGYSSLPRMSMPPHGGGPRYPLPPPHHHPPHHHMMGAPPPPGYAMMGPAHPHHMPPFPSKHNSLPQGYFNWNS